MNNFEFLKQVDKNLFDIITDAEELYRDEYFEQSITQTRRFAENVCKKVLGDARTCEKTFDDMLATLKDKAGHAEQEKEFIEDLYFLKREGNNSTHSSNVKQDGILALECLQRAFEIAISYSVYYCKAKASLLKLRYDTEMLITGKKSRKTLNERYEEEKSKAKSGSKSVKKSKIKKTRITYEKKKYSWFWIFVGFASIVSIIISLTIYLLSFA